MPRQGRFLEIMVQHIKEFLVPENIEVKSPEIFYDGAGVKKAEIDVTLRGKLGDLTTFIGIECRDRPADGKQGIDWITQIKGKQILFDADMMIAVSSTGFTDQAIEAANKLGVELRTIASINDIVLTNWFETIEVVIPTGTHIDNNFEVVGIVNLQPLPSNIAESADFDLNTPFIKTNTQSQLMSLKQIVLPQLETLYLILRTNPQILEMETILEFWSLKAVFNGREYEITKMSVPIKLWQEIFRGKFLLSAYKSPIQDDIIALHGICKVELKNLKLRKILAIGKRSVNGNDYDLKFDFMTEDNEPYPIEGSFALYGLKN